MPIKVYVVCRSYARFEGFIKGETIKKRATTLVVDLQNVYLPTGKLLLVGLKAALANTARVIAAGRATGELTIHSKAPQCQPPRCMPH